MQRLVRGAATAALALMVAGCSSSGPTATSTQGGAVTSAPTTSAPGVTDGGSSGATTAPSPGPTSTTPTSPTPTIHVDQSTPEAAMSGWLTALLAGDSSTVCGLMAVNGTAIEDLPDAKEQCAQAVTPMLVQLKSVKDMFKGLKVQGAKVQGDTATFDTAKTTPDLAAGIIKNLKAVKLKGKWYITQG
ncbi:MAG TPA: hypothetical protein VFM07_05265 [Intrasporangium sp.]|nr:hypothetical protein [Intrasporangium sp.]